VFDEPPREVELGVSGPAEQARISKPAAATAKECIVIGRIRKRFRVDPAEFRESINAHLKWRHPLGSHADSGIIRPACSRCTLNPTVAFEAERAHRADHAAPADLVRRGGCRASFHSFDGRSPSGLGPAQSALEDAQIVSSTFCGNPRSMCFVQV